MGLEFFIVGDRPLLADGVGVTAIVEEPRPVVVGRVVSRIFVKRVIEANGEPAVVAEVIGRIQVNQRVGVDELVLGNELVGAARGLLRILSALGLISTTIV